MSLTDIILALVTLLMLTAMIIPATIYLIIEIKCFDLFMRYKYRGGSCWGMPPCGHPNCRLKRFCPMYQHAITPEVIAELETLLEKRRKELRIKDT